MSGCSVVRKATEERWKTRGGGGGGEQKGERGSGGTGRRERFSRRGEGQRMGEACMCFVRGERVKRLSEEGERRTETSRKGGRLVERWRGRG